MNVKKLAVINLLSFFPLFFAGYVEAEVKTFVREYTYQASEYDSKVSCRTLALEQVKRILLEELGTYLESETEVKDYKLTKDKITIFTAGVVQAEIVSEKWDTDTLKYWLRAHIKADPTKVVEAINSLRKDLQKTRELEETKKKVNELSAEIERLKNELSTDRTNQTKIIQYMKAIEELSALDIIRKCIELSISGKLHEGIEELSNVIKKTPQNALAYAIRGQLYARLGRSDVAIEDSSTAIKLDPDSAFAYINRAYIYYRLREYEEGLQDANRAIALDPNFAFAYITRGAHLYGLESYQRSLEDGEKAVKLSPDNVYAYLVRGGAHEVLGNKIKASEDIRKAIELDPNCAEVLIFKAGYESNRGNTNEGLNYSNKAIKLDPYLAVSYKNRGFIYARKKNYNQAIADFNKAIELAPKFVDAYIGRALVYGAIGNYQQAIFNYNRSIELNPKFSGAYSMRGYAYFQSGNYRQAVEDFIKFIDLAPKADKTMSEVHAILGDSYSKLGDMEQAIKNWKASARLGNKGAQNFLRQRGIGW